MADFDGVVRGDDGHECCDADGDSFWWDGGGEGEGEGGGEVGGVAGEEDEGEEDGAGAHEFYVCGERV